nr:ethanolamine ammonia-lyase subunit EutB [Saccharomonospora sp. CUA-673]
MRYSHSLRDRTYAFDGLVDLLAKATPDRSGDRLAGCAAESDAERVAAQWALADVPLTTFLDEPVVPPETDDVTRLIWESHDDEAFAPLRHQTVGQLREWLLDTATRGDAATRLAAVAPGITPEMAAAVSKLMRNQDLVSVAAATSVTTAFRTTLGLPGRLATRLQPNHPADDPAGVAAPCSTACCSARATR